MKKNITLYNVLFPLWMLMLFPILWLIIIPGNFIIDSLVLIISMKVLKLSGKKDFYKRHILKIFSFGILSDLIGSFYLLVMMMGFELGQMGDEPYLTVPALIISSVSIFLLNYLVTFRETDRKTRLKLSIIFSIVTAPYTFLVPSSWLYQY